MNGYRRARDRFSLDPDIPFALQVEFTSNCNLRCQMCPLTTGTSSSSGSQGGMTDVVFDELLDIARRCKQVVIAGYGEPLTDPRCIPLLRALNADGIKIRMATNGIALSKEIATALGSLEHLIQVNVSIDSPDPATYHRIRLGSVHRAMQGLRNLMEAVDTPDRVTVSSVGMQSNIASLVSFPALLAEIGVRHFSLQGVMDYNDYCVGEQLLDHPELGALVREIEEACDRHGIEFDFSAPERAEADIHDPGRARDRFYGTGKWDEARTRQCLVPWEVPFIDKDGRVFPCCFAGSANAHQVGQLGPETFDQVWVGAPFRKFRDDIIDGHTTPTICRSCTVAPLGEHPLKGWAASLVPGSLRVRHGAAAAVTIQVRNEGTAPWTPEDLVRVGTAAPRDWDSPLAHETWLSGNRAMTFVEQGAAPGAIATFAFPVSVPPEQTITGEFQIVVDGRCWLANTRFAVSVRGPKPPRIHRMARAAQRHQSPLARVARRLLPAALRHRFARLVP